MPVPKIGKNVYISKGAIIRGDVELHDNSSVWFNCVIRADRERVIIGKNSNVQDNCTVHVEDGASVYIGENVTIGHNAVIHGCTIGDNSLIGMNAVIMNHAVIGKNCIIGASALVPNGMEIPDGSLVMGIPAVIVRQVTDLEAEYNVGNAQHYVKEALEYLEAEGCEDIGADEL